MYVQLDSEDKIYNYHVDRLKRHGVGKHFTNKYSLREFNNKVFEKAILSLTNEQIFNILEELETSEYFRKTEKTSERKESA